LIKTFQKSNSALFSQLQSNEFTVEYLSPLVVRKEIENIILNKNKEKEEISLTDAKFMQEHSVIFWNLIWYFKRIGVDSCYLLDTVLNKRINQAKSQLNNENTFSSSIVTLFQTKIAKPYHKHTHIKLTCLWDNLKLKNHVKHYEVSLYLSWLNSGES
jgi:hypothetical protein